MIVYKFGNGVGRAGSGTDDNKMGIMGDRKDQRVKKTSVFKFSLGKGPDRIAAAVLTFDRINFFLSPGNRGLGGDKSSSLKGPDQLRLITGDPLGEEKMEFRSYCHSILSYLCVNL